MKVKNDLVQNPLWTIQTVTVNDEFGGPLQYDLIKPKHLCTPADKNGEDPTAPGG